MWITSRELIRRRDGAVKCIVEADEYQPKFGNHESSHRGGDVVDGTGSEPFRGDVAVDGDQIVEIGKVEGRGKEEIQADGLIVSPGFVDLHTHLDAQIGWDPQVTSVSWHGVTTALLGNCGVTFAPCKPADREFLAGMMETVEDIPKKAILHGLPWNWESYGSYLDALEALGPSINICGLVGHCATRFYVMGERAVEEPATEDEIQQIAALAGQSVKEGAVGFSTNRLPQHRLPDGRSIPGTFAHRDELRAVAREVGAHGGLMQTVSDFREFEEEIALIADEARLARGALFSSALEFGPERLNEKVMAMRAEGLKVTSVTVPRSGGGVGGLMTNNFFRTPAWIALRKHDFDGRLKAIRHPETRRQLIDEVKAQGEPAMETMKRWFWMGDAQRPRYTHQPDESLYHVARAAGEHPVETWLRITDQTDGKALFHLRGFQHRPRSRAKADHEGLGDAGFGGRGRAREPDDRLRLGDLHPVPLGIATQGSTACRRPSAGSARCQPMCSVSTTGAPWPLASVPISMFSTWTGWRSGCRKSSTTSRSARRASSNALSATRRHCATARSFSATTN